MAEADETADPPDSVDADAPDPSPAPGEEPPGQPTEPAPAAVSDTGSDATVEQSPIGPEPDPTEVEAPPVSVDPTQVIEGTPEPATPPPAPTRPIPPPADVGWVAPGPGRPVPPPPGPPGAPAGQVAWGPDVAPPSPGGPTVREPRISVATLVGHFVALGIAFVAALTVWLSVERLPDGYVGDALIPQMAMVAIVASAVAALVSWGEIDLSFIGAIALGGYVYAEVGDESAAAALVLAGLAGLACGVAMGLIRWATQIPMPFLTLGAGLVGLYGTQRLLVSGGGPTFPAQDYELIEGSSVPLGLALVVVAMSVGVASMGKAVPPVADGRQARAIAPSGALRAGPAVIVGTALTGLAGTLGGALLVSRFPGASPALTGGGYPADVLVLVLAALAFGGVRWGSWLLAPVAAALGSVAVVLISSAVSLHGWSAADGPLFISSVALVCLVASHGLHRVLSLGSSRPDVPPPPAGAPWAPYGPQPGAPWAHPGPPAPAPGHPGPPPSPGTPPP